MEITVLICAHCNNQFPEGSEGYSEDYEYLGHTWDIVNVGHRWICKQCAEEEGYD